MTAPAGIRINKVKIPAFPYRSKAEAIVYDCLSEEERELLSSSFRNHDGMETEHYEEDQFAEGLDAEWLEYIGPEDTTTDIPSENSPGAVLYFHGGGYYTGSKEEHRVLIGPLVKRLGKNIRILIVCSTLWLSQWS
jgi:acetyl esterase/lipase